MREDRREKREERRQKTEDRRQRDRETERQRDRETERQRDRETERQRDRETERQRDTQSDRCMCAFFSLSQAVAIDLTDCSRVTMDARATHMQRNSSLNHRVTAHEASYVAPSAGGLTATGSRFALALLQRRA